MYGFTSSYKFYIRHILQVVAAPAWSRQFRYYPSILGGRIGRGGPAALHRIEGKPYLFPGARHGRPLSNMALLQLMCGMGYGVDGYRGDYVPHGFRSSFRDWSGEVSSFPRDVAEIALAHVIENKVEAAYRRGDLFTKWRKMMQEWADYVNNRQAEVIPLNKHA